MFEKYDKELEKCGSEAKFTKEEIKDEILRRENWRNRRKMAWISFATIILMSLVICFYPKITEMQIEGLKYFGFILSTFVISYFGGNVIESIKMK